MGINCRNNCLSPTTDSCVEYTGQDIDVVGIKGGMYYDELIVNLANSLASHIESKVELKCLYDNTCGNCEPFVKIPEAVRSIINKLCALTSDDIEYKGSLYCIGNGSMSSEAVILLGRSFNYSVSTTPSGSSISYNLNDSIKNLPEGYALGSTRVTVTGKKKRGQSLISSTDGQVLSVPIENDRYPVNMQVDVDINTPNGTVRMNKNISVPAPVANSYNVIFDIKDFTSPDTSNITQSKFNDLIAAQLCANSSYIDQLKNIKLSDTSNFNIGGSGVESILGALAAAIEGLYNEISTIKSSIENGCGCSGDC